MYSRNLPPLDLLIPFEAAARHGSFTRAAEELLVTQSAISQRVRTLEDLIGTPLFLRSHRTIELTAEGRELLNGVTAALQHLLSATRNLRRDDPAPRVRLAVDTSVATLWLGPRLGAAMRRQPQAQVDLLISDIESDCLEGDLAILHGAGDWPGFEAVRLFDDAIFPVCAPAYLARHPVGELEDLCHAALIDLDYLHWNWMNWSIWFTEAGLSVPPPAPAIQSNNYPALLDSAREGMGIALGWQHFVDADLDSGALVQPLDVTVGTRFGYYLLLRLDAGDPARALRNALCDAAGAS